MLRHPRTDAATRVGVVLHDPNIDFEQESNHVKNEINR